MHTLMAVSFALGCLLFIPGFVLSFIGPAWAQFGVTADYFAVDDSGTITVTPEGAAAINKEIGNTTFYLNLDAINAQGAKEQIAATIFTCCTPTPTDGPLSMPWMIVKQMKAPPPNDQGFYQWANATIELSVAVDPSQIAEPPTISFDGVVKWTCSDLSQPPKPQRWCLFSNMTWDASQPVAHTIEGQVKLTNGNLYLTTLQIPAN